MLEMEVSSNLLVAIMFVGLLSIGIGNILMTLAAMVDRRSRAAASRVHISWVVLLLLVFFSFFWQTLDVLSIENWTFSLFLFLMLGPVLLIFASQVLLPDPSGTDTGESIERYFEASRLFFVLFAASQIWVIGVDLILGGGLTRIDSMNGVAAVLALILAFSRNGTVHLLLTIAMWLLFVISSVIRGLS